MEEHHFKIPTLDGTIISATTYGQKENALGHVVFINAFGASKMFPFHLSLVLRFSLSRFLSPPSHTTHLFVSSWKILMSLSLSLSLLLYTDCWLPHCLCPSMERHGRSVVQVLVQVWHSTSTMYYVHMYIVGSNYSLVHST